MRRYLLLLVFFAVIPSAASETPTALPVADPYLAFYSEQANMARLEVEKYDLQVTFDKARLARLQNANAAVPQAQILDAERVVALDAVQQRILESRQRRVEAQLQIVRQRLHDNEPVSMCGGIDLSNE